jgi:F-type H+-transporting ATPase subunit alpha
VSRVGGNAQTKAMRAVAKSLRLDLAQYRELAAFAQFGSDLDKATQAQLSRGQRLTELLKQRQYEPISVERQLMLIFAGTQGLLDGVEVGRIAKYEEELNRYIDHHGAELMEKIRTKGSLDDDLTQRIRTFLEEFGQSFAGGGEEPAAVTAPEAAAGA